LRENQGLEYGVRRFFDYPTHRKNGLALRRQSGYYYFCKTIPKELQVTGLTGQTKKGAYP
jgi:hypothetical protein